MMNRSKPEGSDSRLGHFRAIVDATGWYRDRTVRDSSELQGSRGGREDFRPIIRTTGWWRWRHEKLRLAQVVETTSGREVADHLWFIFGELWREADVRPGDVVEFDALWVEKYYQDDSGWHWGYQVSRPSRIVVVERPEEAGDAAAR